MTHVIGLVNIKCLLNLEEFCLKLLHDLTRDKFLTADLNLESE